jgi:transposase-like protein
MAIKERIDKQHRYPWPVIETAVQFYFQNNMTFRSVSEKMLAHGVEVSHKTIYEWVQKFGDKIEKKNRKRIPNYEVEESYIKCNGSWKYMYRACDRHDATLSICLRDKKNLSSAKSFFKKSLEIN